MTFIAAILLAGHTGASVDDEGKSLDVEELEKLPIDHPRRKDLQKMVAVIVDDVSRLCSCQTICSDLLTN